MQIEPGFCNRQCRSDTDLDFNREYVFNPTSSSQQNILNVVDYYEDQYGVNLYTPIGGTYRVALADGYCTDSTTTPAVATINVQCDYSPRVNAGSDRTVVRGDYGWPTIYMNGDASDVNPDQLQYAWKFVDWPKPGNVTTSTTTLLPSLGSTSAPGLTYANTLYPSWTPQYPGTYVLALTVFDGCSFSNDTVTITVRCDTCKLTVSATPFLDIIPYGASGPSSVQSNVNNYDYHYGTTRQWYLESNSNSYTMTPTISGGNKNYALTVVPNEVLVNSTVDTSNTPGSNAPSNSNTTPLTGQYSIVRSEGTRNTATTSTYTTYTETETFYYSSVPIAIPKCTLQISGYTSNAIVTPITDNTYSDPFNPTRSCLGNYVARVDLIENSNTCGGTASKSVGFSLRCGSRPRAHLIDCAKVVRFNYGSNSFPSILLDARDSTDQDTVQTSLYYNYLVQGPASSLSGSATCNGAASCATRTLTPQGEGDYTVTLTVSDTCTYDNDTIRFQTVCDAIVADFAAPATHLDSSTPRNQVDLTAIGSSVASGTISYLWTATGGATFSSSNSVNTTVTFPRGGAYTVTLRVGDGCGFRFLNRTIDYQCTYPIQAVANAFPSQTTFDLSTGSFDTIFLEGSTSAVEQSFATYTWATLQRPVGSVVSVVGNAVNQTFTPDRVGTYLFRLTVNDGCHTSSVNVSVVALCPTFTAPSISSNLTSFVLNRPLATTVPVNFILGSALGTGLTGTWRVINSAGSVVTTLTGDSPVWNANIIGSFTVNYTVGVTSAQASSCPNVFSTNTFTVTCARTATINTFPTQTVTFANNKFPRVQFDTVFTGSDSVIPSDYLPSGTWEFIQAPIDSVFYPSVTTVISTQTLQNSTTTNYNNVAPGVWTKTRTLQTRTTNTTTVVRVFLNNAAQASNAFSACFAPDRAGTYQLLYTTTDYCGNVITQTATVQADCNTSPVASVAATETNVVYNRDGFRSIPITLNGKASTDADGDSLYPLWSLVSAPNGSAITSSSIGNRNTLVTSFTPDRVGDYRFNLTVSDGCSSSTVAFTISVRCSNGVTIPQNVISWKHDGYTPVSLTHFTFAASPRCDFDLYWDVLSYTPPPANNYAPPVENVSAASSLTFSVFAVFCLILAALF